MMAMIALMQWPKEQPLDLNDPACGRLACPALATLIQTCKPKPREHVFQMVVCRPKCRSPRNDGSELVRLDLPNWGTAGLPDVPVPPTGARPTPAPGMAGADRDTQPAGHVLRESSAGPAAAASKLAQFEPAPCGRAIISRRAFMCRRMCRAVSN